MFKNYCQNKTQNIYKKQIDILLIEKIKKKFWNKNKKTVLNRNLEISNKQQVQNNMNWTENNINC